MLGLEVVERIWRRSADMQRTIEALVEARNRAMEEAQASSDTAEEILYARACARGRSEPTVIRLRLLELSQELTEATHEPARQQGEELRSARVATQDLTRHEASLCLDMRGASNRLTEAHTAIDSQEEHIHRQEQACTERRAAPTKEKSAPSGMAGGVDPAVGQVRRTSGPFALVGLPHQVQRQDAQHVDRESGCRPAYSKRGPSMPVMWRAAIRAKSLRKKCRPISQSRVGYTPR